MIIRETIRTARKQYDCDASEWITNYGSLSTIMEELKMPFSDRRKLVIAHQERYKIYPGTKYIEQIGTFEGDFFHVRGRIDIIEICRKYNLFYEE